MTIHLYFSSVLLLAAAAEWFFYKKREGNRKEAAENQQRHHVAVALALAFSLFLCFQLKAHTTTVHITAKTAGFVILFHGAMIRSWAYIILSGHSSELLSSLQYRPLFSHGPYRFHRHPLHAGFFLMALGSGLYISNHWLAAPLVFILLGSALHPLMRQEEQFFEKKYGDIYTYWSKRRFRFVPFFY
ncbi:isoprenylcysteine carboxylmethyltransferase family protein [Salipaludibacillus sp. CUR1]|uniref:methyltransferase family protein n=1 Tax=Salipaludibacillus sp. CUR1 TaxID=2820003 RepID=UPI001E2F0959|nr:isoprenylcysteine carboxylmethyltransferase family protein [Salipaludibacillus sp. CUR1]MCE7793078.1 isoprenylcysteine carboxylmethyltransferase family protein [Salipaludibacillus sp. CUR1]